MTRANATFSSRLAPGFAQYVNLKRSTTRLALSNLWTDSSTKLPSTQT